MRTCLDDSPMLQYHDAVGIRYCGKPVGDNNAGTPPCYVVQGFLHDSLRIGIHIGRGFIQYQDGWIGQDGAGETYKLALPRAQGPASFSYPGVIAVFKMGNEVMNAGGFCRLNDLGMVGFQASVAYVILDTTGKKEWVRENESYLP